MDTIVKLALLGGAGWAAYRVVQARQLDIPATMALKHYGLTVPAVGRLMRDQYKKQVADALASGATPEQIPMCAKRWCVG